MTLAIALVVVLALVMLAGALAIADTAISRTTRVKAIQLEQNKRPGGAALVKIAEDPAPFLNAVLLLRVASIVAAAAVIISEAVEQFDAVGEVVASILLTVVLFILAEVVPRSYAVQRTDRAALLTARPVLFLGRTLRPVSAVLIGLANAALLVLPGRRMPKGPFVTEDEIRHMVDVAEEEEEIEEGERELIHSIFEFGDTVVREVMVPRPDMVTIHTSSKLDEALETIIAAGYSRIPIHDGDADNIIGVLYAKDLMKRMHENKDENKDARVGSLGRAPTFIPEQKRVSDLLREMQEQRVHMAIVVDEYGGTAGLVTIEDLIEEIVGEIVDEYDQEEPLVEPIDDTAMRVDAKMPIDEVNDLFDVELPDEEWDTVGGLVFGLTGRVPVEGETVRFDGLLFQTERVTGRRIQKVVIRKSPVEESPEESGRE